MEENKKTLNKTKKVVLIVSIICVILIIVAIAVTVAIKNSFIGKNKAEQIALNDMGFEKSDVSALRSELDFDDGHFQYEVEFYHNGAEYEYTVMAENGDIISKDVDDAKTNSVEQNSSVDDKQTDLLINEITQDDAKSAALADAGLIESDVTFTKVQLDDDFITAYEIEFYTDESEYEYKIDADNGTVIEKSMKTLVEH